MISGALVAPGGLPPWAVREAWAGRRRQNGAAASLRLQVPEEHMAAPRKQARHRAGGAWAGDTRGDAGGEEVAEVETQKVCWECS